MEGAGGMGAALYGWWLLVNGVVFWGEYGFLHRFLHGQTRRRGQLLLYLGLNCGLLACTLALGLPSLVREGAHTGCLCLFSRFVLRRQWADTVAPAAILFTLSTLVEGGAAIVMRVLAAEVDSHRVGTALQMALTLLTTLLLLLAFRFIAGRYGRPAAGALVSYLYLLLLPCGFVVWVLRFGMGLDGAVQFPSSAPFGAGAPLWAVACLVGAGITFFVILEVFAKVLQLADRAREGAFLEAQLREQRTYLAEAAKRAEAYRAFQHDIRNHLLTIAGLFRTERYGQAQAYLERLNVMADGLTVQVSTGNAVLDVLLSEKLDHARRNGISVTHHIRLPQPLAVEDIDLCVVFSNAMDNAIAACVQVPREGRHIRITAGVRHQFLLLEISNPCHGVGPWRPGTGLQNIARIADKYGGTAETEKADHHFRLSVLLCCGPGEGPPLAKPEKPFP